MRKSFLVIMVLLFAASFLIGAFTADTQAAPPCRIVCDGLNGYRCCKVKGVETCTYDPSIDCVEPR
ncbi:MAG: hypothetical protein AB1644_05800 [Candidatus Zixiibacteriota bacterium]